MSSGGLFFMCQLVCLGVTNAPTGLLEREAGWTGNENEERSSSRAKCSPLTILEAASRCMRRRDADSFPAGRYLTIAQAWIVPSTLHDRSVAAREKGERGMVSEKIKSSMVILGIATLDSCQIHVEIDIGVYLCTAEMVRLDAAWERRNPRDDKNPGAPECATSI